MKKYSLRSRVLHWMIALLAVALLAGGFFGQTIPIEEKAAFYSPHKSVGLTLLALMAFRIYAIRADGYPELPAQAALWQKTLARGVQYGLYGLLLLQPLSGWVMSSASGHTPVYFGLFAVPFPFIHDAPSIAHIARNVHGVCPWLIIMLMVLHITGSIKHYFFDRDNVVQTML
ncbi:MAG: cytochrome b [Gammaproteobacteria bacterium]|nr:cytochrome b [Gammaproteobacteria bacterium]